MAAYHNVITLPGLALTSVTSQAMPYFHTSSHKGTFSKKFSNVKCVIWFSLQILNEAIIIRRAERDIITNKHTSS